MNYRIKHTFTVLLEQLILYKIICIIIHSYVYIKQLGEEL